MLAPLLGRAATGVPSDSYRPVVTQAADKYTRSGVIKVGAVTQLIFILAMFAATLGDGRLSIDMQVPSITRP